MIPRNLIDRAGRHVCTSGDQWIRELHISFVFQKSNTAKSILLALQWSLWPIAFPVPCRE